MNENAGRIFLHFHFFLPFGKLVVGQNKAFLGFQNKIEEVSIGGNGVKYLTSEEYNALSHDEKMKDIAYMVPDMNQELTDYHYSNPNLLINADFRYPVNQNGKSTYSNSADGYTYTVDGWYLHGPGTAQIVTNGITITPANLTNFCDFRQTCSLSEYDLRQYILTVSAIVNGELVTATGIGNSYSHATTVDGKFEVYFSCENDRNFVGIRRSTITHKEPYTITAVKLEIGSSQTLAHRDGTVLVLNDPPKFDLQYALSTQYSPYNGNRIGYPFHNENLLDNWYFGDPINQRGQTTYAADGYCIDRWINNFGSLEIMDDCIKMASTGTTINNSTHTRLVQKIDRDVSDAIITYSVFVKNGSGKIFISNHNFIDFDGYGVYSVTSANVNYSTDGFFIDIMSDNAEIIAVKAEIGSTQTLAHREGDTWVLNDPPPNKATELAKCQRYYIGHRLGTVYHTSDSDFVYCRTYLPIRMRMLPVMTGDWTIRTIDNNRTLTGNIEVCEIREDSIGFKINNMSETVPCYIYTDNGGLSAEL